LDSSPKQRRTTLSAQSNSYSGVADLLASRRKQSILVVDDNLVNAALLKDLLATRGYQAIAVQSAAAAEAEIRMQAPDLILLDVVMPGKSGYEVCRELKADSKTRLIPIVMITGLSAREDRLKGIEAGADDFLTKPISAEELFARVGSLLKLKEFTDELETIDSVLCTLGLSVEARDPYTEGHCERLAQNASDLGSFLGLDEESLLALRRGGYLHDLGKISVPFANKTFSRRRTFKPFFARYPIRTISSPGFNVFPFQPAILDTRFGLLSSPCHFSIERSSFVMSMKISIWGFRK